MRILLAPGPMYPEPGGIPLVTPESGLGAAAVARALSTGWEDQRPDDVLTRLPLPDGGSGTAQAISEDRIGAWTAVEAAGPLGQVREADLLCLRPSDLGRAGTAAVSGARATWLLDTARLLALPADRGQAALEARAGTTKGLGQALAAALRITAPGDTLVATLGPTAVHDGGLGALDGLGGLEAARTLMTGRELVLALADDTPLGGVSGAGQALAAVTALGGEECQELNRRACAAASGLVSRAGAVHNGNLPIVGAQAQALSVTSRGTGAGGGAALVLRALGARAVPGPRAMSSLLGLRDAVAGQDLVVTAAGEIYDVVADSVVAVVGEAAGKRALPTVLVAGKMALPRGELAAAGVVSAYSLEELHAGRNGGWNVGGASALRERLAVTGARLARTWSR
ncbi:glycerate kinase [Actinomyces sp.]|uniref:glycerate kinase n=1 Tax=Actinomyces sp. TaxID=29317 RepID=UPI0026DCA299|nr:glycerate kinase [Actinomyces sp.]MDO4900079.1 glycerate kinase [Actinomyces sp.]